MPPEDMDIDLEDGSADANLLDDSSENELEDENEEEIEEEGEDSETDDEEPDIESESEDDEEESDDEDDDEDDDELEKPKAKKAAEDEDDELDEELIDDSLYKTLKAKHPEALKIPGLREAIHREKQFTEVFTTPEQAKMAAGMANLHRQMESDILGGNVKDLLVAVSKTNTESLQRVAHNLLPSLAEIDRNLYGEIMQVPFKNAIRAMYHQGKQWKNQNMQAAAVLMHEWIFQDRDLDKDIPPKFGEKEESPEAKALAERERKIFETQRDSFTEDVSEAITHSLRHRIKKGIVKGMGDTAKNISDYQMKKIVEDIFHRVDQQLGKDKRHLHANATLYTQAASAGFSKEWKSRVISAYLERAQKLIPMNRRNVLTEAGYLKKGEKTEKKPTRLSPSASSSTRGPQLKHTDLKPGVSDADILSDNPKRYLKK